MAAEASPVWWVELIKVSPGLITAALAVGLAVVYRGELRALATRATKFKAFGIEAEFASRQIDEAIAASNAAVSGVEKEGALRRLRFVAPLLRDARILWVDDDPSSTRHLRALLESFGTRTTVATTSAEAEEALRRNVYALVITDLKREGKENEGLDFLRRTIAARTARPTVAYVGSDQKDQSRPAGLFAITNRPDELVHYVCDVIERERL